jgi:tetratricopeptide (TPR) repeat protein
MRRLNLVFLAILLAASVLLGGGVHLLHGFQVRRNASALLERARRAEADKDLPKAEQVLSQYLNLEREDPDAWRTYARVVDQQDPERRRPASVFMVHEEALHRDSDNLELERRCADLALELGRYKDARGYLEDLYKRVSKDAQGQGRPAAEQAELEDLLGQCERGLAHYETARDWFEKALDDDPHRVDTYDRLARMQRAELGQIGKADATINRMMTANPKAGRAFIYQWRYRQGFAPPTDAGEIKKALGEIKQALELAPDDLEVLYTAAVVAAGQTPPELAAARAHFEKGCRLDPKSPAFALGLAHLELREGHPQQAEAVLRRAYQANPSLAIAFELADLLISQDKQDQASDYLTRLRNAGLGDTLVRFLEAEVLVQQATTPPASEQKWRAAIDKLEMARAVLGREPRLMTRLDLMLAECHGRRHDDERRLEALERAAAGEGGRESAGLALAQALARSGKLDQAVTVLLPLATRRPEWRLDLVQLLLRRTIRQPRDQQDWAEVERQLGEAEKAPSQAVEPLVLLRLEMLAARNKLKDARTILDQALAKDPRNLRYRLAQARLTQRTDPGPEALRIIDQAEKDLGPSPEIVLARLDYWGQLGGPKAKAALAKLAASRQQARATARPALLDRLGAVAIRLGELGPARQYWRELAALQPENLAVRLGLFDLALAAGDRDAAALVDEIQKAEGEEGTSWQFARAAFLLDRARRGDPQGLDEARTLAEKITRRRPNSWIGPTLNGEIAELSGSLDKAIEHYLHALELGNFQPLFARRLVGLLTQRDRPDDRKKINHVTQVLGGQGAALAEVKIVKALDAIRRQDFKTGIDLALQVFPENSANASDQLNLGRIYLAAGRTVEAGKAFRLAVELGPGLPDIWLAYVQYLVRSQQIAQARQAVAQAGQALPPDRATLTLAQCYLFLGDARNAEALIRKALDTEGGAEDPAALRLAVGFYLGQNRAAEAENYLDQLERLADAPPGEKAWANRTRAAILLSKGRAADREQALARLDRNLREDSESLEDQRLKATILAMKPDGREKAAAILERLAGTNRLGTEERFLLARLYLGQGDEEKYRGEMLKLLGLKAPDPRHLAHFANHCITRGQLDEARGRLAELKTAEPKGLAALELEARLLDLRGRKPELLALLEARGRQVPDQIGPVADLLNRYGFAKQAEAAYKAFIARDPRQPERSLALAQFLAGQDRPAEAMEVLKRAWTTCRPEQVAIAASEVFNAPSAGEAERQQVEAWVAEAVRRLPDSILLASKLGVIWIRQGRFDEAEGLLRRVLSGQPDSTDALNNLAWLLSLRDPGKAGEAVALINRAIDIQGEVPSLADTRAVARIRSGQFDQAVTDLLAIRKQSPSNPSFALHLAWAYYARGQRDRARAEFQEAEKLGLEPRILDPLELAIVQKLRHELSSG